MNWKKIAYLLYPILIGILLPVLFFWAGRSEHEARAGVIRYAELSPERPLIVRLAMGRTTAITFSTRPEKVVPGNPLAVEINFLGRDLTLRPLEHLPGNLIVYTKSNRYVILLQVVPENVYDDAIVVNGVASYSKPIRLIEDTFTVEEIKITDSATKKDSSISVLVRREGRVLESDAFPYGLRCKSCVLKGTQLVCARPVKRLECKVGGKEQILERKQASS